MPEIYKLPANEDGKIWFSRQFAALDPYDTKGNYILTEEFWASWQDGETVYRLRTPKGLITDVASVPRWGWSISGIERDGLHRNAALLHDILYMFQGKMPSGYFQYKNEAGEWVDCDKAWTKDACDRFFLRVMKACGVGPTRRWVMYQAVHIGGGHAWRTVDTQGQEKYRNAFAA